MTHKITSVTGLGNNVPLDEQQWGITLICGRKNHAMILFEGVHEGISFRKIAHLTGKKALKVTGSPQSLEKERAVQEMGQLAKSRVSSLSSCEGSNYSFYEKIGKVEFKNITSDFFIGKKSETWVFTRDKVETFMNRLKEEGGKDYPFSILGSRSVLADKAEGIDIRHPILVAVSLANPNLFLCLYDSAQNKGLCTRMSQENFHWEIKRVMQKISTTPYELIDRHEGRKLKYIEDEDAHHLSHTYTYDDLIQLIIEEDEPSQLMDQESCCTWAQKQLTSIGVTMPSNWFDSLITVTRSHLKHQGNSVVFEERVRENLNAGQWMVDGADVIRPYLVPLKGRLVTYEKTRDKKPEEMKQVEQKTKDAVIEVGILGLGTGMVGYVGGVLAMVGAPTIGVPLMAGVALTTAIAGTAGVAYSLFDLYKLRRRKKEITTIMQGGPKSPSKD